MPWRWFVMGPLWERYGAVILRRINGRLRGPGPGPGAPGGVFGAYGA